MTKSEFKHVIGMIIFTIIILGILGIIYYVCSDISCADENFAENPECFIND